MLPGKGPPRRRSRNKFELLNDQEVAFKMLRSNESLLEEELNELRSRRRKFLCLNDNLEHGVNVTRDAALRRLLKQFFSSLYPLPSTFERPAGQVNRFLYIDQYRAWRRDVDSAGDLYFSLSYLFILINVILFLKMLV